MVKRDSFFISIRSCKVFGNYRCLYYEIFHAVNIQYEHNIVIFIRLVSVVLKIYI